MHARGRADRPPGPASSPAYFELGRRSHFNYLGTGRETRAETYFSVFTFGAGDPNPTEAVVPFPHRERLAPLVAFLAPIAAPAPPAAAARCGRADFGDSGWRAGRSAYKRRVGFVVDLAAEFGGDDLVTVVLDNNDSEDITAGDGIVLGAGGYWLLRENFGLQGTLAYKIKQTSADNSDLGLERWIVDVSAITFVDDFQFAAGLVHHTNIDFDGDGFLPDFSFDDATGLKLEIGYSWFALSYTNIDYEVNGFSFDASNVGLRLRGGF